jgi:hypothetical protein
MIFYSEKMKQELKILIVLFCCCCFLNFSYAQQAIIATGGNASGSGGTISYSVGQVSYNRLTGTGVFIIEGVQQPYEISVVTSIESTEGITLACTVYPNPVAGFLHLVTGPTNSDKLFYRLFDMNGVLLLENRVENSDTEIFIGNFPASIYFLKVIKNNSEIKVFKIVKR